MTKRGDGLSVSLVLRTKDDRELARGEGSGRYPIQAVRAAMEAMRGPAPLPVAQGPSAWISKWMRVRSTNAALVLYDLSAVAAVEDVDAMRVECARVDASTELLPDVKYAYDYECAYRLYRPRPAPPTGIDTSAPGGMRFVLSATDAPPPEEARKSARRLHELFEAESDVQGRAMLAGTEALLIMFAGDPSEAGTLARRSLSIDPKAAEPWTSTWRIFAFASGDRTRTAAAAGWLPWDPYAMINAGELDPAPDAKLRYTRRAAILSPGGSAPPMLVDLLLKVGRTEEARSVAATAANPMLDVQVRAADAHFAEALTLASKAFGRAPVTEEGAVTAFGVARVAIDPALILERPLDFADDLVKRFVDPEPPTLPRSYGSYLGLVATCTYAPSAVGRRCLPRLRELHARGLGFPGSSVAPLLAGAERYVNGDYSGAAKAWRPLLKDGGRATDALRHAMAQTFDHESQSDLAAKIDAEAPGGRYNGADLADVRVARRASSSGDRDRARKHASRVVEAWSVADDTVPTVAQMRKLSSAP